MGRPSCVNPQGTDAAGLARLQDVAAECEKKGAKVKALTGDLAKAGTASTLVSTARETFGKIECIVHAAGFAEGDFRKQIEAQTPLGRIGQPSDIGPAAVFLASADSSWISGETLVIAGGYR